MKEVGNVTTAPAKRGKLSIDRPSAGLRELAPLNPDCVVCGPENPSGLQLQFHSSKDAVWASWRPNDHWASFKGTVHGGIVSTVLDEAMSKAVIATRYEALTAELRVRFRERIVPGDQLNVVGWVVDKRRGLIATEALITCSNGREKAHAWGKFLISRRDGQRRSE